MFLPRTVEKLANRRGLFQVAGSNPPSNQTISVCSRSDRALLPLHLRFRPFAPKGVTHGSGTFCNLCLGTGALEVYQLTNAELHWWSGFDVTKGLSQVFGRFFLN